MTRDEAVKLALELEEAESTGDVLLDLDLLAEGFAAGAAEAAEAARMRKAQQMDAWLDL